MWRESKKPLEQQRPFGQHQTYTFVLEASGWQRDHHEALEICIVQEAAPL